MSQAINFKALKEQVSMFDLLKWYGLLDSFQADGKGGLKGPCPFKCDSTSGVSFKISDGGKAWYQHDKACKCLPKNPITQEPVRGGNILEFVMFKEGLGLRAAGEKVQAFISAKSAQPIKAVQSESQKTPSDGQGEPADRKMPDRHQTFSERGYKPLTLDVTSHHVECTGIDLSDEDFTLAGIGYARTGMMKHRVAFPIRNIDGDLIAYGGLRTQADQEKWLFPKDFFPELEVVGLDEAKAKSSDSVTSAHGILVISFDLLEQAKVAGAMGSDFNLSVAILSERLSAQQKTAFTVFCKEGFDGHFLIRVPSGNVPKVVAELLLFLPALNFTKLMFFE